MSGVEHGDCPPELHSVHECNMRRDENPAEMAQQPDEVPVEALDGPGRHTETPEAAEGRTAGTERVETPVAIYGAILAAFPHEEPCTFPDRDCHCGAHEIRTKVANLIANLGLPSAEQPTEARDRALLARHFRVLASAVNVADWPAYLRKVAAGHEAGTSWYKPVQDAPEEPEPPTALCNYDHTEEEHERAGACERPGLGQRRRPHWLPEESWMGVIVGQWPLQAFPSREMAERWAASAVWSDERRVHETRRIWRVEIPVDTQTFKAEKIPASTRLTEVTG